MDLSELVFLSKELCNAKIYSYPIIIFEFTEGFYITKDIYLSQFNKQLLSSEKTDLKPLMSSKKKKEVSFFKYNEKVKEWEFFYKQNLNLRAEKQEALSRLNEKILQATKDCENINDRKILNAKIQDIKAQINETKIRCEDYRDAITLLRKIISDKESDLHIAKTIMNNNTYYSEFAQKKKENKNEENCDFVETLGEPAKEEIQSSRSNVQTTENEYFQGNDEKENCNEDSTLSKNPNTPMNTIPSNPSNNEISQEFEMAENFWSPIPKVTFITNNQIDENSKEDSNHQYYSEYAKTFKGYNPVIKAKLDKLTKKVDKYKIMLNTLRNKKIAEIAFFFFNSTCSKFYIVPAINQDDKNALFKFYDKHSRELSVMTGVIAQLLAYMSSLFNVTLTYPMLVNGSKSFMVKNKKE